MFEATSPGQAAVLENPTYERKKARATQRERIQSKSGREISGDFQPLDKSLILNKKRILKSLQHFCKVIFPDVFYLPWSQDHPKIISKLETAIIKGDQFAIAMARGTGKSALSRAACLWAILNGYHNFVVLIASTADAAGELLDAVRTQLETNDLLLKYFPEVCYPIRRLEGITQRRLLWHGEQIRVEMTDRRIVFPSLPPNPAASAVMTVAGLTGRIRGLNFTRPDGQEVRPSLVLLDDPQDDESAKSEKQSDDREKVINGAVLGLGGPDRNITAVACVTVICAGDLADRVLDRLRNPQWRGERTRLVDRWPTHPEAERLWAEYEEILRRCMREDGPTIPATEFYARHRKEMDAGAVLRWKQRKGPDCLSALQHAYNLRIRRGPVAFECEYQNNPPAPEATETKKLEADQIRARINRIPRGTVPAQTQKLTAFIDIQQAVLFWLIVGWDDNFGGAIVDYGTWPAQSRLSFDLSNLTRTLQDELPTGGIEAQVHNGLTQLADKLLSREWPRDAGPDPPGPPGPPAASFARIEKCLVDANWGPVTDVVYQWCRSSPHATILTPSHGQFISARRTTGMNEWQRRPGEQSGPGWRSPPPSKRPIRHVSYDTNFWKSHAAARLLTPLGSPSALTLNGDRADVHHLLAEHLTAEYATAVTAHSRTVDEWQLYPGRRNDWFDALVGNCVAGSMLGLRLPESRPLPKKRPRVSYF